MGGKDKLIEADETYIGNKISVKKRRISSYVKRMPDGKLQRVFPKRGASNKYTVVSLVERGGSVRSFHVDRATRANVREILVRNADRASKLMTDESVNHGCKEYAHGDAYTNTIEVYYSIFKRGMIGTYLHCGESHLQRYVTEFDFRYNGRKLNDNERRDVALKGIEGKRLIYRRINTAA